MDCLCCSTLRETVELHPPDLSLKRSGRLSLPAIVECTRTFLWLRCHPKPCDCKNCLKCHLSAIVYACLRFHVCSCKPSTVRSNLRMKVGGERDLNIQQPGHGNVAEEFHVRMHLSTCICVCSCACVLMCLRTES